MQSPENETPEVEGEVGRHFIKVEAKGDGMYLVTFSDSRTELVSPTSLLDVVKNTVVKNIKKHSSSLPGSPRSRFASSTSDFSLVSGTSSMQSFGSSSKRSVSDLEDEIEEEKSRKKSKTVATKASVSPKGGLKLRGGAKSSSYHGVSWHSQRKRWRAYVYITAGKQKYLGTFSDQVQAAREYDKAVIQYSLRSPLNFPTTSPAEFALVSTPPPSTIWSAPCNQTPDIASAFPGFDIQSFLQQQRNEALQSQFTKLFLNIPRQQSTSQPKISAVTGYMNLLG